MSIAALLTAKPNKYKISKLFMNIEDQIHLNKYVPRPYQLPFCKAIVSEGGKYHKLLIVNPRRSGKDYAFWNLTIRAALTWKKGLYLYCLPTFSQARSVIWEGMASGTKDSEGKKFIDLIPPQLIEKVRDNVMTINLVGGSVIRLIGSDNYDRSIVGSNAVWIIFSEYAQCDENAYKLAASPIIKENGGVVAMISTPRGQNHMYELFEIAQNSPDWFTQLLTVEDTQHLSIEEIKKEIISGEISEDMALQEYYCSFRFGQEGSYYAKYLDKMKLDGRIGHVPWEPYHRVHTSWDLGIKDPTCIIFFQVIGQIIRIIDYYEQSDRPMDHFAKVVLDKPYIYGYHFPPNDVMQRESNRGLTKKELYNELGIKFTEPVHIGIDDGIELVRRFFSKIWIDERNCSKLIKALTNYREEFDLKKKTYKGRPLHDWSSHGADAMRYLAAALPKTADSKSNPKELEKRYIKALYGVDNSNMPSIFRTDLPEY
jgi:phage terminase large subunit